uniref:Secreted protein n=1 Tax=Meloidogyne incognita TaxID=6306 RepID=A0A914P0U7_MELIC
MFFLQVRTQHSFRLAKSSVLACCLSSITIICFDFWRAHTETHFVAYAAHHRRLTHFIYIAFTPPASLSQLRHFNFSQGLLLFLSTVTECQIITAFEGSLKFLRLSL